MRWVRTTASVRISRNWWTCAVASSSSSICEHREHFSLETVLLPNQQPSALVVFALQLFESKQEKFFSKIISEMDHIEDEDNKKPYKVSVAICFASSQRRSSTFPIHHPAQNEQHFAPSLFVFILHVCRDSNKKSAKFNYPVRRGLQISFVLKLNLFLPRPADFLAVFLCTKTSREAHTERQFSGRLCNLNFRSPKTSKKTQSSENVGQTKTISAAAMMSLFPLFSHRSP